MRGWAFLSTVIVALAVAPVAGAKGRGMARYQLCGATACAPIDGGPESVLVLDSNAARPAPPSSDFYRVVFAEDRASVYYAIPDRELVGAAVNADGTLAWYSLHGTEVAKRLRAATRGLTPYPRRESWTEPSAPSDRNWLPWMFAAGLLVAGGAVLGRVRLRRLATTP